MLSLYHAPVTRSLRIRWLLEELGTPHELIPINFFGGGRDAPAFRALNPMGSLPVIVDDGFVLIESGAIIGWILSRHGDGRFVFPAGSRKAALTDQWMHWSESLLAIHQRIYWDHCAPPPGCIADPVPRLGHESRDAAIMVLGMLEKALGDSDFLLGDLSGADFMMSFPLFFAARDGWLAGLPKVGAYYERMAARPAFQTAVADSEKLLAKFEAMQAQTVRAKTVQG